jgi:hypothetical protein
MHTALRSQHHVLLRLLTGVVAVAFMVAWLLLAAKQQKFIHGGRHHTFMDQAKLHYWQDFNIAYNQFFGEHNNVTYQAHVWLRLICRHEHVEAQMVTAWHRTPYDTSNGHGHVLFPQELFTNGTFPDIQFVSRGPGSAADIREVQHHREEPVSPWWYSAQSGNATLAHDTSYAVQMLGSEVQHEVVTSACSVRHQLFSRKESGWVVAVSEANQRADPAQFAWLVAQHAWHHKCLGMDGLILVTTPAKAQLLLEHHATAQAVQKGALVIVVWVG